MKSKRTILYFSLFILVVGFQIFIPARLIWQQENILVTGKSFKFKTAPIDPNDPFRGKFITLRFENDELKTDSPNKNLNPAQEIFVTIEENEEGFAIPSAISAFQPDHTQDYLTAHIAYIANDHIVIQYPFDRFYMEETKAPKAERLYFDAARDSTQIAYALVKVKSGQSVLEDVFINGVSVRDVE